MQCDGIELEPPVTRTSEELDDYLFIDESNFKSLESKIVPLPSS